MSVDPTMHPLFALLVIFGAQSAVSAFVLTYQPPSPVALGKLQAMQPLMSGAEEPPRTFTRARLLPGDNGPVSARDVVNVLGRWKTHEEWNTIGRLVEIDALFDDSWQPLEKLPTLSPSFFSMRRVL